MEEGNYLRKFKLLLEYVFEGKVVLNESTTEKLLKFLEDRRDNSPGKSLLDTPSFSDLIFHSLKGLPNATTSAKIFLIGLTTVLFKNELQFTKMQMQYLQGPCIKYCIIDNLATKNAGLQLACIKLATVQMTHCSGIKLLLEHKVWQYVLCPCIHRTTFAIEQAAYNFISQLTQKLNEYARETELNEVLEYVVKPILTSQYLNVQEIDPEMDKALSDEIIPRLRALLKILTDSENVAVNHIVPILRTTFLIEPALFSVFKATKSFQILSLLNELTFKFHYIQYRHLLFSGKIDEYCNEVIISLHNSILQCVKKREVRAVTDLCIKCHIFLSNFEKTNKDILKCPITFERNGQKFALSSQLLIHLITPQVVYSFQKQAGRRSQAETDDFAERLLSKIVTVVTEHMLSNCYAYRFLLEELDITEVVIETIREMFRLKGHLTASQAGIYFQSLFYVLDVFILTDGAGALILNENPLHRASDERLLTLVLDAMQMVLKEHNISWYENVEIVSLQEGLVNLLKQNTLNTKQIVKVLDLIDICVRKFLSPNMTLLVECRQDSTLTEIGAVMKQYMLHEDWEVRDSALNLLLSCTDISFIKYIPLQKVITENNLMIIAANVALTDLEYYSQSTGLKCLAAATKIESIWRAVLTDNPHIYLQLVYILRNNPKGMVRQEATKVLTRIYKNQRLTPTFQSTLYEVMVSAALDDLHWEVQLAALQFWKHVINTQLTNRGMIDGKFPSVTFSKEKRKIIMLTDSEIIRQLASIMKDLSSMGCLTVLCECMNEVYNIEIMEQAYCMARGLIEILDKYKFSGIKDNAIMYTTEESVKVIKQEVEMDLTCTIDPETRDSVIDSILNTSQSELIMNLHDNFFRTKEDEMEEDYRIYIPRKEIIHPNKFLETFRGTDYLSIIKDKKNWNSDVYNSLDVLLDDILDV